MKPMIVLDSDEEKCIKVKKKKMGVEAFKRKKY